MEILYRTLESRIDNAILRAGFAPTRLAARQLVSHGHILLNGRKVTIPSIELKAGDRLSIREGSAKKTVFSTLEERLKNPSTGGQVPSWLKVDADKKTIEIQGVPKLKADELLFNIGQVLQFYSQ